MSSDDMIMWSPGVTLEAIEKQVVLRAFRHYRGNKTSTANALGIAIRTLDNKLEKYQLDAKQEKEKADNGIRSREEQLARHRGFVPDNTSAHLAPKTVEAKKPSAHLNEGVLLESASNTPAQSPVPVPKRSEVQSVLPVQAKQGGAYKRR